jgi:hypothetical protein
MPVMTLAMLAGIPQPVSAEVSISLSAFEHRPVRLLVEAVDGAADSLLEAAIDDLRIFMTR